MLKAYLFITWFGYVYSCSVQLNDENCGTRKHNDIYTRLLIIAFFVTANNWGNTKHPSTGNILNKL